MTSTAGLFKSDSSHFSALNGLRAFAIIFVLIAHFYMNVGQSLGLDGIPAWILLNLTSGVDLFFVLSGFLISNILYKEWQKNSDISLREFYLKRTLRIFPAYYVYLLLNNLVFFGWRRALEHQGGEDHLKAASELSQAISRSRFDFLYISNYFTGAHAHTWSLSTEEQFYLIFPLLLLLLLRVAHQNRRVLFVSMGLLYFFPLANRLIYANLVSADQDWHSIYYPFHMRYDALFAGVLAMLVYNSVPKDKLFSGRRPTILLAVAAFLLITAHCMPVDEPLNLNALKFSLFNLGYATLLLSCLNPQLNGFTRFLSTSPLNVIAKLSYSMYLWHGLVGGIGVAIVMRGKSTAAPGMVLLSFLVGFLLTMLGALISYSLVERPFLRLRDRILSRKSAAN